MPSIKPFALFALLSLGVSSAAVAQSAAFSQCDTQFYKKFAPVPSTSHPGKQRALCFEGFAVLHSGVSKTPIYVAEYLDRGLVLQAKGLPRTDRFYEEARLPAVERARLLDYKGSGYDRGHLASAGQRATPESMAQSFSLANMVPQDPNNNRGPWAKSVENPTRQYALRATTGIYVYTGPLYGPSVKKIGQGQVWVPDSLFKLIYDPSRQRAWAYVLPNKGTARVKRTLSYEELVQMTGIQFLPAGTVTGGR
ncbi:DNA/RNA non-specific endonuclease [Comamonas thiooxydans]|uniref:DNA/RNA non-specific endonuclease n=1 Tax=Comamonas thiooxydans TaxID=363952 RepID=UPI00209BFC4B|nr:DNA/RNA non-specific endonuclease [Comamonas thiooxydans]